MKIAITADVHLTTNAERPERHNALGKILEQLADREIAHLIIAGDLFDRDQHDFSEFEALCSKPEHRGTAIYVIRGNHDRALRAADIAARNVRVVDEAEMLEFGGGTMPFLLVPYEDVAIGERIAAMTGSLEPGRWVLVGHGDYTGGRRDVNPHEPGVYMPLSRADIDRFKPAEVFLGHIHVARDFDNVHYPGSPCGLDINETGRRSFIVYDTDSGLVERHSVDTDVLWFNERFTVVPSEDEVERLRIAARERTDGWRLDDADIPKARIRVQARGYARDRSAVHDALDHAFAGYVFHDEQGADVSGLKVADDERCTAIAREAVERIHALARPKGEEQPDDDQVILAALELIYGDSNNRD